MGFHRVIESKERTDADVQVSAVAVLDAVVEAGDKVEYLLWVSWPIQIIVFLLIHVSPPFPWLWVLVGSPLLCLHCPLSESRYPDEGESSLPIGFISLQTWGNRYVCRACTVYLSVLDQVLGNNWDKQTADQITQPLFVACINIQSPVLRTRAREILKSFQYQCCFEVDAAARVVEETWRRVDEGRDEEACDYREIMMELGLAVLLD